MFSSQIPLAALIDHCQALRHQTDAGLGLARAMKQQGERGPRPVRPIAARLARRLEQGDDLADALEDEARFYPPLFRAICRVAEASGSLPEAFRELEEYYRMQQLLWREFIKQITWPAIQLVLAILVIALVIYILGIIPANETFTILGLKGAVGVQIFLGTVFAVTVLGVAGYWITRQVLGAGGAVDRFLLRIPYLGGCLQALALSRFSLAMSILIEGGSKINEALRLSLGATANDAFVERTKPAVAMIKGGNSLTETLREQPLFPSDFVDIVETGEVSGREPAVFHKLAEQNHELAATRMRVLATVAARLVWLLVAVFIIIIIFNIAFQYLNVIQGTMKQLGV
ncbi:MAG TPA: type II secretion system F family protein [Gemmatales bacterium]|nr:type II secretion system F family protein [Gemmatales bacterium]